MRDYVPMFAGLMQAGARGGSSGPEPMQGAEPQAGDHVIERCSMSPFNGMQPDILFRSLGVDTILLSSAFTNFAVEHAARDGADAGFRMVLVGDASSTMRAESQRATTDYAMKMLAAQKRWFAHFGRRLSDRGSWCFGARKGPEALR